MSVFHENMLIGASGQGAAGPTAGRSVRFNAPDSAYLSRTPASAGNRRTATLSFWVKRTRYVPGTNDIVFGASSTFIYFDGNTGGLRVQSLSGSSFDITTPGTYRDFSAWSHFVVAFDLNNATSTDRIKIYHNGVLVHNGTATSADFPLNSITEHTIGATAGGGQPASFYLALVHWIDGQALTPSSFGETSATTGQWIAKTYSGSYGTNGFFLDFLDNSTAAALGYDAAGSNDWTVNNLSVTAGSGNDSLRDHPTSAGTSTGLGGEVSGNYATLNPLISTSSTLSNGNLDYTSTGTYQSAYSTIGMSSGKWYFEGTCTQFATDALIGVGYAPFTTSTYVGGSATSWGYEGALGDLYTNSSGSSFGNTYTTNDIISVAFDADTGKLWFAKNGTWQASGNPANGTNPAVTLTTGRTYFFGVSAANTGKWSCNYGARAFAYTAPSGFSPLVDTLLPTPTIAKPNTVMDVLLWTGTSSASNRTLTGLNFSPDLVWGKARSVAYGHRLYDSVRGAGNNKDLNSASTGAEGAGTDDQYGYISSFDSAGFSTTAGTADNDQWNSTNQTFAAWCWDAGSSNATNTSGTITSTVRANISAGFSVMTYTGTGSNATVGHGLGVAPQFIIGKNRDSGSFAWRIYHSALGATKTIYLNMTNAAVTDTDPWNNTAPTSSVVTLLGGGALNRSAQGSVLYCWTPVAGYSAFGSYTGNGSSDGPFVYTGFRPAVVLVKMSSSTGNWTILDDKREGYNVTNDPLYPNLSNGEGTSNLIDITSNGFKVRTTDATFNTNAGTYIYAAWASAPFPYARAR